MTPPALTSPANHTALAARTCGHCVHFCNAPATIEATYKGLSSMSSGYASVRAHDGLCNRHDVYLSYRDRCPDFSPASHLTEQR